MPRTAHSASNRRRRNLPQIFVARRRQDGNQFRISQYLCRVPPCVDHLCDRRWIVDGFGGPHCRDQFDGELAKLVARQKLHPRENVWHDVGDKLANLGARCINATNNRDVTDEASRACAARDAVVSARSSASLRRTTKTRLVDLLSQSSTVALPRSCRSADETG